MRTQETTALMPNNQSEAWPSDNTYSRLSKNKHCPPKRCFTEEDSKASIQLLRICWLIRNQALASLLKVTTYGQGCRLILKDGVLLLPSCASFSRRVVDFREDFRPSNSATSAMPRKPMADHKNTDVPM